MFKKAFKVVAVEIAASFQGVAQDFVWGKKARKGRTGAWKAPKASRARARRTAYRRDMTPRMVVVHIHEGAAVHF